MFLLTGREVTSVFTRVEKCHTHELEEVYDGVYSLQFSYDGEYLAVGYGDSGIDVSIFTQFVC